VQQPELRFERQEPVWLYPQYFWRKGIITGFNFSQASFTNWAAGGENNLNLITFASIYFRKSTLRYEWENLIDGAYGVQSFRGLDVIRKSEDKLEFTSKIGHKTTETLITSFLFNFKTQFDAGFQYRDNNERTKVSNFLAPAYITTSLGLDYKPSKVFSLLLSPIAGKITLVMDQELADEGRFGVEKAVLDTAGNVIVPGKNSRSQLGMTLNARLTQNLGKNITLNSKLDMFGDYEKPTSIDISWDNSIIFRVNNAISANLSTALIYDEDILIKKEGEEVGNPRIQFKEIFSLGVRFDIWVSFQHFLTQGPIGIFDSGYGGLTVLKEIISELPEYDYLYLGDNARAPYGTRSFETVYQYTLECVEKLFKMNCSLVILACNTSSAKALRTIQQQDLPQMDPSKRVLGIIRPSAEIIGDYTSSGHVGILATPG